VSALRCSLRPQSPVVKRREDDVVRGGGRAEAREPNENLVGEGSHGEEHRNDTGGRTGRRAGRMAPRRQRIRARWVEWPKLERREVKDVPALGVRGEEDLEAPIQVVPLHHAS